MLWSFFRLQCPKTSPDNFKYIVMKLFQNSSRLAIYKIPLFTFIFLKKPGRFKYIAMKLHKLTSSNTLLWSFTNLPRLAIYKIPLFTFIILKKIVTPGHCLKDCSPLRHSVTRKYSPFLHSFTYYLKLISQAYRVDNKKFVLMMMPIIKWSSHSWWRICCDHCRVVLVDSVFAITSLANHHIKLALYKALLFALD